MRQAAPEAPKQAPVPLCLGVLMGFGLVRVIIQVADVGSVGERERELCSKLPLLARFLSVSFVLPAALPLLDSGDMPCRLNVCC